MEHLVLVYIAWSKRKSWDAAASTFNFSWDAMYQYCCYADAEVPALELQCPFMWDLRAQVQTASNNLQVLAVDLRSSDLKKNFRVGEQDGAALSLQVKYISQAMTASLTQAKSLHACTARLLP